MILYIQCLPAQADYSEAALAYKTGNYARAFIEYKTYAERGDVRAQVEVGWMYYQGEGVRQDKAQALDWFRKAAEQGDITSMFNLAYGYEHGDGVPRDLNESRRWYAKAVGQRSALEKFDFERLTNTFLISNDSESRIAKAWAEQKILSAKKAAESGIAAPTTVTEAARTVDVLPEEGQRHKSAAPVEMSSAAIEKPRDPRLQGIVRSAEAGDTNAQVALGWIYSSGKGIPVDKVAAAKWYRLAAEKGNLKAQAALGWMYYEGEGVESNLNQSALWYGKAASQGDKKSGQMLKRIKFLLGRD